MHCSTHTSGLACCKSEVLNDCAIVAALCNVHETCKHLPDCPGVVICLLIY